ncbi:putative peptidase C14 caspase catalytic subunit p20 [Magnetofaba australis IT-1]|uniref:Putative peptidase C14 caspase catalytic subunit p20 n=1 Tax=Magnetofaba australis IT-1 TaxID=1434232 RepID=A0A1Y2K2Q5_9PROT|nr:putative peptidase C14 caspase catalytic subunit p20 [Magnetofaba australis IT-1]
MRVLPAKSAAPVLINYNGDTLSNPYPGVQYDYQQSLVRNALPTLQRYFQAQPEGKQPLPTLELQLSELDAYFKIAKVKAAFYGTLIKVGLKLEAKLRAPDGRVIDAFSVERGVNHKPEMDIMPPVLPKADQPLPQALNAVVAWLFESPRIMAALSTPPGMWGRAAGSSAALETHLQSRESALREQVAQLKQQVSQQQAAAQQQAELEASRQAELQAQMREQVRQALARERAELRAKLETEAQARRAQEAQAKAQAEAQRQQAAQLAAQQAKQRQEAKRQAMLRSLGRYHALVIGINDYQQGLSPLRTAVGDAQAVAEELKSSYGYDVQTLLNATRSDIVRALTAYRKTLTKQDNLLIYYAGHGWLDKAGDEGYWLPSDAGREDPTNWISNAFLTSVLKALQAKHVMVVADSCFSGKLVRGVRIEQKAPDYLQRLANKRARVVLAAGGLEPVLDAGGKGGHSVFASAFLEALRRNESVMEGSALFTAIRRPVALNADQTPEYADIRKAGHDGGDFLFVKR